MMPTAVPGGLPDEYLQVQYLESGGTQHFWTDVEVQDGLTVESRQSLISGNDSYLFGGADGSNDNRTCFNGFYRKSVQGAYPGTYYNSAISGAEYGDIYTIKTTHENGVATIYVNGSLLGTLTRTGSVVGNGTKCVCFGAGRYYNPTTKAANFFKGKVYFIKVSKGNALLANYVPCVRIADSKPGMYDLVGRQFYTNAGTDEFVAGFDGWDYFIYQKYGNTTRLCPVQIPITAGQTITIAWSGNKSSSYTYKLWGLHDDATFNETTRTNLGCGDIPSAIRQEGQLVYTVATSGNLVVGGLNAPGSGQSINAYTFPGDWIKVKIT